MDHTHIAEEIERLEDDLFEGDLTLAEERLFYLFSSLLLDPSAISDVDDGYHFRAKVDQEKRGRRRFQKPICALYAQYRKQWITRLRLEFDAQYRRSHQRWTGAVHRLVQEQLHDLSDALYNTDEELKFLAVRWLLRFIDDRSALRHLHQTRDDLCRYQSDLEDQIWEHSGRIEQTKEQEMTQSLRQAERNNRNLKDQVLETNRQLSETNHQLATEQQHRRRSERRAAESHATAQRAQHLFDELQERSTRQQRAQEQHFQQLQEEMSELTSKLATLQQPPAWKQRMDEEEAASRAYANKLQEIKNDKSLSRPVRQQLVEHWTQLWAQTQMEMLTPTDEGDSAWQHEDDEQELLQDDRPLVLLPDPNGDR